MEQVYILSYTALHMLDNFYLKVIITLCHNRYIMQTNSYRQIPVKFVLAKALPILFIPIS